MSDQDIPTSGSRWEPAAGGPGHAEEPAGYAAAPAPFASEPAEHGTFSSDDAQPAAPTRRRPGRGALAAAGVGLVLAGGIGGFAIGHTVAGNATSTGTVSDQNGVPGGGEGFGGPRDLDGDRGPDGFRSGDGAPDGTSPDGAAPGGTSQGDAPPITGGGTA